MSMRSVTIPLPPSTIRSNWCASVIAAQTPPSASSAMPSGGPSRSSAKIRRSDSAAVRADRERGQSPADRLGDDQGRAVRRDDHSVGEVEVVGDDGGVSSGSTRTMTPPSRAWDPTYARPGRRRPCRRGWRAPVRTGRRCGRRCRRRTASTCRFSVEAINSEPSGRKPRPDGAWPGSGSVVIDPAQVDGVHCLAQHVGEPQQPLEPPRSLAEAETVGQRRQASHLYKSRPKCHAR